MRWGEKEVLSVQPTGTSYINPFSGPSPHHTPPGRKGLSFFMQDGAVEGFEEAQAEAYGMDEGGRDMCIIFVVFPLLILISEYCAEDRVHFGSRRNVMISSLLEIARSIFVCFLVVHNCTNFIFRLLSAQSKL